VETTAPCCFITQCASREDNAWPTAGCHNQGLQSLVWLRLQFTCIRCGREQWQENGHSVQSSRRVRATPLKERSEPRGVWLMRFVWLLLQVVSTDTLAVGSFCAIDSLAPVAKDKRDQITSFSILASSQLLGRCVAERSRFDRYQLSV